jgi:hypothetical protein
VNGTFQWIDGKGAVDLRFLVDDRRKVAVLQTRLRYVLASGEVREAKQGLITDGTSLPPILWPFYGHPFDAAHCREAIVHDAGYQEAPPEDGSVWTIWRAMFSPARAAVDVALREALHANPRLSGVAAETMYVAVRLCGWIPWRRHARNNALIAQGGLTDVS